MTTAGRVWAAITGLIVVGGIVIQLLVTANGHEGFFPDNPERVFNVFAYFTIQSNLLLGGTALLLALRPDRPQSTLFRDAAAERRALHRGDRDRLPRWCWPATGRPDRAGRAVANLLLHTAAPVVGVLGWLLFGPRGRTDLAHRRLVARVSAAVAGVHAGPRRVRRLLSVPVRGRRRARLRHGCC